MPGRLGFPEVLLILVVVLIVFGVGKLPQVGEALGKGLRAFRQGQTGEELKSVTTSAQPERETTKARLVTTEAKLKALEESAKKT